jgi:hypothetical protein
VEDINGTGLLSLSYPVPPRRVDNYCYGGDRPLSPSNERIDAHSFVASYSLSPVWRLLYSVELVERIVE